MPLLIAKSNQIVGILIKEFIDDCFDRNLDRSILTFKDLELNSKWKFPILDCHCLVNEVKEKEVISEYTTVRIYHI